MNEYTLDFDHPNNYELTPLMIMKNITARLSIMMFLQFFIWGAILQFFCDYGFLFIGGF